jgi:hypothetical protein
VNIPYRTYEIILSGQILTWQNFRKKRNKKRVQNAF